MASVHVKDNWTVLQLSPAICGPNELCKSAVDHCKYKNTSSFPLPCDSTRWWLWRQSLEAYWWGCKEENWAHPQFLALVIRYGTKSFFKKHGDEGALTCEIWSVICAFQNRSKLDDQSQQATILNLLGESTCDCVWEGIALVQLCEDSIPENRCKLQQIQGWVMTFQRNKTMHNLFDWKGQTVWTCATDWECVLASRKKPVNLQGKCWQLFLRGQQYVQYDTAHASNSLLVSDNSCRTRREQGTRPWLKTWICSKGGLCSARYIWRLPCNIL